MSLQKFLVFLLVITILPFLVEAQSTTRDTIYFPNKPHKIWKIESKRGGKKMDPTLIYLSYSDTDKLKKYEFYIQDSLYGFSINYSWSGFISYTTNFRNNQALFRRSYHRNGKIGYEGIFSPVGIYTQYDSNQVIKSIYYPDLKEKIQFYPNKQVKSIALYNNTTPVTRTYYEFSPEGNLMVEGIYADSSVEITDTIITFDPDTYDEIVQVIVTDEPLKHGVWSYYSNQGVLLEQKEYHYYTEKKNIYISDY